MIDRKAVRRYHKRVDRRLAERGIRLDGNRWEENKHPRSKDGKFTSGSGGGAGSSPDEGSKKKETSAPAAPPKPPIKMNVTKSSGDYVDKLTEAKKSLPENQAPWRVTQYKDGDEFDDWHPGAKMYHTDGGSTIAVTPDGDIVGVCHHEGDPVRGKELLKHAVDNGGKKLDAYEGLFGFYTKCGFEPVSWCKWDEKFAPSDWKKGRDNPEHIIFYKYTGKSSPYKSASEFFSKVKASKDYDAAKNARDKEV